METNNNEDKMLDAANDIVEAADAEVIGKKRNVKGIIIAAVIAVLAIAGVAGAMNAGRLGNYIKKTTSSPKEYYQYVEKENRNEALKGLDKTYNSLPMKGTDTFQKKMTTRIELGDALKPFLSSIGLESLEVEGNSKVQDKEVTAKSVIKVNDADALTYNVYLNYETGAMYMQIPELSEKYIDFSSLQNQAGLNYGQLFSGNPNLPDEKTVQNIMKTYTDIVFNDISDVKKSTEKLEVEGVSEKCTKLEAKIDANTCYKIIEDAAKKLETDEDIKQIIDNIDSSLYKDFQDAVKSFNEEMSSIENGENEDINMQMDVYVDNDGDIVGRTFTAESDGDSFTLKNLAPKNGKKFGYEFSVEVNGVTYVTLDGSGERKSGKLDATYNLSVDESITEDEDMKLLISNTKDMITLEINDFDEKAWEDGILKGEFTVSSDMNAMLALYSLKFKFEGDKNNQSMEVSVLGGTTPMVTLSTVTSDDAEDPQVTAPGDDAEKFDFSYDTAFEEYLSEADLEGFLGNLKDKCGVDLSSLGMFLPSGDDELSDLGDIGLDDYESTDLSDILGE